jgi:hypothetical protein
MTDLITFDRHVSPAVGRCIYCGSDGGQDGLRKEHGIPFSLGGNIILPQASCSTCEGVISYLEGYVGRRVFGSMRSFYEIQKRRRPQPAPTVSVLFETKDGKESRQIPLKDAPPMLLMCQFPQPGMLSGQQPSPLARLDDVWLWYSHEVQQYAERMRQPGDKGWTVQFDFKEDLFGRFLAKVVHCMAIAQFGIDSFRPFLPEVILGKEKNIGFYVGGMSLGTTPDPDLPKGTHKISAHHFAFTQMLNEATGHRVLVGTLRLFAFTGAPTYCAVVGEPGATIAAQLE